MLAAPGLLHRRSYSLNSRAFPAALPRPWRGPWHTFPLGKVVFPCSGAKGVLLKALFLSQSNAGFRLCLRMRGGTHKMWGGRSRVRAAPGTQLGTARTSSLGQGLAICLSVCPGAPICLPILVHSPACPSRCRG